MTVMYWGRVTPKSKAAHPTDEEPQSANLVEDYLGIDHRILIILVSLTIATLLAVTAFYIVNNGFGTWASNMKRAGSMMVINFDQPIPIRAIDPTGQPQQPPVSGQIAIQHICPNCGATALPHFSPDGTPYCPNCGSVMTVTNNISGPMQRR